MKSYRTRRSGFTLVEILIVVIILGILAAIVIPQFTNASSDARNNSVTSQLQTLRNQIELYKVQHNELWPTTDGAAGSAWSWARLTGKTDEDGTINAASGKLGPYMQQVPTNPVNGKTAVGAAAGATIGWLFDSATGKIYATGSNPATQYFDEATMNPKSTTAPF